MNLASHGALCRLTQLARGTAPSACLCEQSSSTVPWPSRPFPLYSSALQGGTKHQEGAGQVHT